MAIEVVAGATCGRTLNQSVSRNSWENSGMAPPPRDKSKLVTRRLWSNLLGTSVKYNEASKAETSLQVIENAPNVIQRDRSDCGKICPSFAFIMAAAGPHRRHHVRKLHSFFLYRPRINNATVNPVSKVTKTKKKFTGTNPENLWSRSTSCVGGVSPSTPTGDCILDQDEATTSPRFMIAHHLILPRLLNTFPHEWNSRLCGHAAPLSMPNTTRRALLRGPTNSGSAPFFVGLSQGPHCRCFQLPGVENRRNGER